MQLYQKFWTNQIPGADLQLVIDWDTFIESFRAQIQKYCSITINTTQMQYIKTIIDPQNRGQIYKSAYLLFIKNFWQLPSNRTRFFKMRIKIQKNIFKKIEILKPCKYQQVIINIQYKNINSQLQNYQYYYTNNKLLNINQKQNSKQIIIQQHHKNFITIGASSNNDIEINNCNFINKMHFKLINIIEQVQVKKQFQFVTEEKKIQYFQMRTKWFIRDISKSNRLAYLINKPYKFVILKPGMQIKIGLTTEYQLQIKQINKTNAQVFNLSPKYLNNLYELINTDRLDLLGDVDHSIPQKILINFDNSSMKPTIIDSMYQLGQFYPIISYSNPSNEQQGYIHLVVLNCNTLQQTKYELRTRKIYVGRDISKCQIVIDSITIRSIECTIEFFNGCWLLKNINEVTGQKWNNNNKLAVYLPTFNQLNKQQNSNRQILSTHQYGNQFIAQYLKLFIKINQQQFQPLPSDY